MAQTCSIISSNYVCKEELMKFDVTSSTGIDSLRWSMCDSTSATQNTFHHKFSTKGIKNVKATISLKGGDTCRANKQITVYELSKIKIFENPDNEYCLFQNIICLGDSSIDGDIGIRVKSD